jgi:hypothetical protein
LSHNAPRKAVDARLEAIHQRLEGSEVALLRPPKQF